MDEREEIIQKLERTSGLFDQLFEKDPDGMIIGYEQRAELRTLKARNEKILQKLKTREFTVAVVGLEKAGKSTLGNALIKSIMLPEYTERCTYTTTEIRAGDVDEAEIFFYSKEEFDRNFQALMRSVEYGGNADFRTMNLDVFNRYWTAVENAADTDSQKQNLFQTHNGTTVEDIRAILQGKNDIANLLGQPPKKFVGADEITRGDFQVYITGINGTTDDGRAIRSSHPYAVKNVVIRSTQLHEMDNIVLYDVPGFDSPTDLHKKQTEKMLAEADAIILVTNVGDRPNLVGTQLDMLRKVRDDDNIRLSEKSFVFGNKLDRAGTPERAKGNTAALKNDAVRKYQITTESRIVFGSAKAFLESHGILSKDDLERGMTGADQTLKNWNFSDGIDELHEKMRHYYDTDRLDVLKTRIQKTLTDTEKFLREILEKYPPEMLDRLDVGGRYLLVMKDKVAEFTREASTIRNRHRSQIQAEKPFSTALINDIENIYPLMEKFSQMVEDTKNERYGTISDMQPLDPVESSLREKLQMRFIENMINAATNATGNKQQEIRDELVAKFLEIIGMESTSPYKDELTKSVNDLFDSFFPINPGILSSQFNPLIERFTRGLVDTLIYNKFATRDRYNSVVGNLPELFSIAAYYSLDMNAKELRDDPAERMKIFAKILVHEGVEKSSNAEDPNEIPLRTYFQDNEDDILDSARFSLEEFPIKTWAQMLTKSGVQLSEKPPKDLSRALEDVFYKSGWNKLPKEDRISSFNKAFENYCRNVNKTNNGASLAEQLRELYQRSVTMEAKDEAEMLSNLDTDIEILRDLTKHAAIKAIGLETAFTAVFTKNIDLIRQKISEPGDGADKFNDWIERNVYKIKESEYAAIERDNMNKQTRKIIVESISQVLEKLET